MKSTFRRELDELKFDVLDLSTELELERHRTNELEKQLNETLRHETDVIDNDGSQGKCIYCKNFNGSNTDGSFADSIRKTCLYTLDPLSPTFI